MKCRFPLMFKVLLRENSGNPAALLLVATSQRMDHFEIAQVFGVSCKLSDIRWAQMDSCKLLTQTGCFRGETHTSTPSAASPLHL